MRSDDRLLGTWTLASWVHIASNGTVTHPHGPKGTGRLIYAPQQRMAGFLMAPEHKLGPASHGDPLFVSYSGRVEITDDVVNHHVDFASDIRMLDQILSRRMHWISDDELRLETLAPVGGAPRQSRHELTWRRVRGA